MDAPEDVAALIREYEELRDDIAFVRAFRNAKIATVNGDIAVQYEPRSENMLIDLRSLSASGEAPDGSLPAQTGNAGKILTTDGTTLSWL